MLRYLQSLFSKPENAVENICLTPAQEAVQNTQVPIVSVIARAGTGKTATMVAKAQRILKNPQNKVLFLSFSKAAANEVHRRLKQKSELKERFLSSTFHSFAFQCLTNASCPQIMLNDGLTFSLQNMHLLNENRRQNFLDYFAARQCQDLHLPGDWQKTLSLNLNHHSLQENGLVKLLDSYLIYQKMWPRLIKFYSENACLDFDFLILLFEQALMNDPSFFSEFSPQFTHLIVDEFQDCNQSQMHILKMIYHCPSIQQVTAVGDPLQTLYDWRGASPKNFEQILSWSSKSQNFSLLHNFRSGQNIIDHINGLIPSLKNSPLKLLCSRLDLKANVASPSSLAEALMVLKRQGVKDHEITILSYKRRSCLAIKKELSEIAEFHSHDLLKKRGLCRFLAFLYLLFDRQDLPSLWHLAQSKQVNLSPEEVKTVFAQSYFSDELQNLNNLDINKKSLNKSLKRLVKIDELIKGEQWLCERLISYFCLQLSWHRDAIDLLNHFSLNELFPPQESKKILISTIHQFKGRQSKAIILYRDFKIQSIADERLYYVALSRAEEQLIIIDKL